MSTLRGRSRVIRSAKKAGLRLLADLSLFLFKICSIIVVTGAFVFYLAGLPDSGAYFTAWAQSESLVVTFGGEAPQAAAAVWEEEADGFLEEDPDQLNEDPEQMEEDPPQLDEDPDQMEEDPAQLDEDPDQMEEDPDQLNEDPEQMEEDPDQMEADPGAETEGGSGQEQADDPGTGEDIEPDEGLPTGPESEPDEKPEPGVGQMEEQP